MSIVTELNGKAGRVCPRSYRGGNGCPLVIRPTSEDVLVGNVFGILRRLRPSLWLRPMLTEAFNTRRFVSNSMRGLDVAFWRRASPPSVRRGIETSSEPDVTIRFGNTVLLLEAKYRSALATHTSGDPVRDQVARLLDVAFHETRAEQFFRRDPYVMVLGMWDEEPKLVAQCRDPRRLAEALDHHRRFPDYAAMVKLLSRRVGYLSWRRLAALLVAAGPRATQLEGALLGDLVKYIDHKRKTASMSVEELGQRALPLSPSPETP